MHDIDIDGRRPGLAAGFANQRHQPLDTHGKTAGRCRLAAELLHQTVVTTTGTDGSLRAEAISEPLENRQVVVVEAAHQARIDLERQTGIAQHLLHALEMRQRLGPQVIDQSWCTE
jgi:hypothetical protein